MVESEAALGDYPLLLMNLNAPTAAWSDYDNLKLLYNAPHKLLSAYGVSGFSVEQPSQPEKQFLVSALALVSPRPTPQVLSSQPKNVKKLWAALDRCRMHRQRTLEIAKSHSEWVAGGWWTVEALALSELGGELVNYFDLVHLSYGIEISFVLFICLMLLACFSRVDDLQNTTFLEVVPSSPFYAAMPRLPFVVSGAGKPRHRKIALRQPQLYHVYHVSQFKDFDHGRASPVLVARKTDANA
nr:hypothetical protein Iba_chr07aCG4590 [Ipomoea batatas]